MNDNDEIRKDIVVAFDFVEQILEKPELLEQISDGEEIKFLDNETPKIEKIKGTSAKKYVKVKRQFEFL